ncbi:MAG: hypothetical protein WC453_01100 [Patescibacteria group bacterium]
MSTAEEILNAFNATSKLDFIFKLGGILAAEEILADRAAVRLFEPEYPYMPISKVGNPGYDVLETLNQFPDGRIMALVNKVGGLAAAQDILAGNKVCRLEASTIKLVDKSGRFIPPINLDIDVSHEDYNICRPSDKPVSEFMRMSDFVPGDDQINFETFSRRTNKIIDRIKSDPRLAGLLSQSHFQIILPKVEVQDCGFVLENFFMPWLDKYYFKFFAPQHFNSRVRTLIKNIDFRRDSRYIRLLAAMTGGVVPAVYFPLALRGFTAEEARKFISVLPEDIILSGVFDVFAAAIGYPKELFDSLLPVDLLMAACYFKGEEDSTFSLSTRKGGLVFEKVGLFGEDTLCGVTFI